MTELNPNDSVLDEQFAVPEGTSESTKETQAEKQEEKSSSEPPDQPEKSEAINEKSVKDEKKKGKRKRTDEPGALGHAESSDTEVLHDLDDIVLPPVDYSGYSKTELIETLTLIIDNRPPAEIREDVERIKIFFYKKLRQETEERKAKFLEGGGKLEDYKIYVDPLEHRLKELLEKYKAKKTDFGKVQEAEKNENLKKKYDIIDKIKDLVNREESINKTFQEFRTLRMNGILPE